MIAKGYVPKQCVFETTLACNLKCRHCGSMAGRPRENELSTREAKALFEDLADLGCIRLTLSGGEPMCRSDWPELIEAAALTGMHVAMITNAVAFDDEAAKRAKDKGLRAVGFSLDGPRDVHDWIRGRVGHFERISRAMDASLAAGLGFGVISFVNRKNLDRLDEMYDFIARKGAYAWQVQLGADMGNLSENRGLLLLPEQLPRLETSLAALIEKRALKIEVADSIGYFGPHEEVLRSSRNPSCFKGCKAGISVLGIESDGHVKGCLSIMAGYNEQGAQYREGNIRNERLSEIWNRPGAFAYNRKWRIEDLGGACRGCEAAEICRGGCLSQRVAAGDGVSNPMCIRRVREEAVFEEGKSCNLHRKARTPYVAAALIASLLGTAGCNDDLSPVPMYGAPRDEWDSDSDTDTDSDSEADT